VWPDEAALERLRLAARWAGEQAGYRAVRADRLHVTAAFIGEVGIHLVADLHDALRDACAGWASFTAPFGPIEALPDARRPRVLALGFGEDRSFAALLDQVAESLALVAETPALLKSRQRPARPHVTLARWKGRGRPRPINLGESPEIGGELAVTRVNLIRSVLRADGPAYDVLEEVRLEEGL